MRVTNSMMITNMLSNLNTNLNVMSRKQDELSTGKRVIFASDDPVAAAKILKFKTDIADMTQYSKNTRDAQAMLDASESTVSEMGSVLQRVRELIVKAANGTNTKDDTQKIREEIIQLRDHLISGGNSNFTGKYQFSAYFTDKPLLTSDGKYNIPITAQDLINKPVAIYEISPKEYMPVGTYGVDLFGYELDVSSFSSLMPSDVMVKGVAAQKAAIQTDFSLTTDYTAQTLGVNIGAMTFNVNTINLKGTALKPVDMQSVLDEYRNSMSGTTKLSTVADVYFDGNKKLVVRTKNIGATNNVTLTASAGLTNLVNISNPENQLPTALSTIVAGVNSLNTNVTGGAVTAPNVADFRGKSFVMTYNGVTKTILIPNDAILINSPATLQTNLQSSIDTAFGVGKVTVGTAPLKFETVLNPLDPVKPELRIQKVVTTETKMIKDMNTFIGYLDIGDTTAISGFVGKIDGHMNQLLAVRADIGARSNRLELIEARIAENSVTFTRLLSDSQDADMAEVIMALKNAENVYKSALSVGGKIIQPSLLDFIR